MNRNEVKESLLLLIEKQTFFSNCLTDRDYDNIDLIDSMGMDSISFVTMIVEIEDEFQIIIPVEDLLMDRFRKLDDIVDIIFDQLSHNLEDKETLA